MFIAMLFTIIKIWKQTKVPSNKPSDKKMCYINTLEYYLAIKKSEILPIVTAQMDLEGIMLHEISQSEKNKYHIVSLICGI